MSAQAAIRCRCRPEAFNRARSTDPGRRADCSRHAAPDQALGHGEEYLYPHDYEEGVVTQRYAPDSVADRVYYEPSAHGMEARFAERARRIRAILRRPGGSAAR